MTSSLPSISIILAWYNTEVTFLRTALESVISQDYDGPLELVVGIDGGADPALTRALEELLAARVAPRVPCHIIRSDTRGGASAVRNLASSRANGDWLLVLDADDALAPESVRVLLANATRGDYQWVTAECWFHEGGQTLLRQPQRYLDLARRYRGTLSDPLAQAVFSLHPSMISRQAFTELGGFSLAYTWAAELTELFARFVVRYGIDRVHAVPQPLYHYHRHGGGLSANRARMHTHRLRLLQSYCDDIGLPVDEIRYLARCDTTGAQHYQLLVDGSPHVPPYIERGSSQLRLRGSSPISSRERAPSPRWGADPHESRLLASE
ncbi:glycosyltransferase family 2 protein [Haliangium ochraceum]|uniref:Glycosyl transferase family 2 n=1 Tax=Haliangium ochraceum (strain DSM 14365 / JCM 11303 / SMP-2) TaxID=502025 RepID=D0LXW6_HALO1|nr:glycosyltransferase family 2 protein [Haliangium ochraceum]ACY14321.1 glycosyl transferase family 2 [Haliangium ochraceum DSM 14365]